VYPGTRAGSQPVRTAATATPPPGGDSRRLDDARPHSTPPQQDVPGAAAVLERLGAHRAPAERYVVREQIAAGGMGRILRVWDADLRRHLAMKTMRAPARAGEAMALVRFLEEAQIHGQLEHPCIVPVHEIGLDAQGRAYFTMPLVRGEDFRRVIERARAGDARWPLARRIDVVRKVCEAVAYAHSRGVLHRDIKPTNVMVGRFGEVYLMDWGLACVRTRRDVHDLRLRDEDRAAAERVLTDRSLVCEQTPDSPLITLDGTVVGTPSYMPPEQAGGHVDQLGPRSDVYALGAMLYHVLTGSMPYARELEQATPHVVLAALLRAPPRPVLELAPHTPADLAAICAKAMHGLPERRYATAEALAADLRAWLERRPIAARPPSLARELRLSIARNPLASRVAFGAALALIVSALLFVHGLRRALDEAAEQRAAAVERGDELATSALVAAADRLGPTPVHLASLETWITESRDVLARAPGSLKGEERQAALAPILERALAWRECARQLEARTLEAEAAAWRAAAEDVRLSPLYGGLELAPQLGLVPLRRDGGSGLWEFWAAASGERPLAPLAEDRWELQPQDGIVLVLVPGARASLSTPDGEGRRAVGIAPFFLSKYELTQAQYERLTGLRPSFFTPGTRLPESYASARQTFTAQNPVECVSWHDATAFTGRLGLRLPTTEEWEYASRAGSESCYGFESLEGVENVADQSALMAELFGKAPWDDGFAVTAPVGSFEPNPFGFFDLHGNVSEWMADTDIVDWTGRRNANVRRLRGGSYYLPVEYASACFPQQDDAAARNNTRGLRPARDLVR
jgi:serine/threonine protein kinase/formylglycine-generating enzyme required for sulfatase activity